MQKTSKIIGIAAMVTGLALMGTGCSEPNYEGEGNEFTIRGPIIDVGERSVKIYPEEIVVTEGTADGWFHEDDETRVHNNYFDEWCEMETVSDEILEGLEEGDWIEIEGAIRESKDSCGKGQSWSERPVFTEIREVMR